MESVQVQNKFKILFEKICEPGYVMNNYYADGVINKLTHDAEPDVLNMKMLTMLSEWLTEAINRITECHHTVRVFVTRLLAVTSHQELLFTKVFGKIGDVILKGFKDINSSNINPSLRVAHMEVALAIVSHDTGVTWLLETGVWKEILSLSDEKQTVFVVRQTYKFASLFVWRLNDLNDGINLRVVLSHILKPISEIDVININSITSEQEEDLTKTIKPMMLTLQAIVTQVDRIQKPNIIIDIILKEFGAVSYLLVVSDRLRNMTLPSLTVAFWLLIAKIFANKPRMPDTVYSTEDFIEMSAMYFNTIQMFVQRRSATNILDFCTSCNMNWAAVSKNDNLKYDQDCIKIHNQLLFMCLVPVIVYIKEFGKNNSPEGCYERIVEYVDKLFNHSCEHTTRAAYAVRDLTMQLDALSVTMQSVKRLTCLKTQLNNEQANLVFQAMFYVLIKYDPTSNDNALDFDDNQDVIQMMTYVLDTVLYLVKNHDISWRESLEVICLYNIVYNILKRTNLSCKFIVTGLNVIALTVKKFLPPNLSLLLESQPGSSMHELGRLIYMKMHDRNWEIRDSALELLLVCTEISFIKFPPFQKQIMENNLIDVAATIALNDSESYVQASALKCVGAASKIGAIWEQLQTQYPDIQDKLISILRNNQEGIVRKEACDVLREVYQNIKLSPSFKHTLYEHMVSSALCDFHWEVQISALSFWRIVIQSCLSDQGMLDGTFPPVTFSRETRKIVTLNETEIQKILLRTLEELAQIGCLTVLVKLLNEDTEVDILDAALSVSSDLVKILDQYKVPDIIKFNENDIGTVKELLCYIKEEEVNIDQPTSDSEPTPTSDTVIDSIMNADDINLLSKIYERHMNIQGKKTETCTPKIKLLKVASPYLFVNHTKTDFKAIVEHKKKWKEGIRSLSSLLDDVLGIYELNDDVNTLDCY